MALKIENILIYICRGFMIIYSGGKDMGMGREFFFRVLKRGCRNRRHFGGDHFGMTINTKKQRNSGFFQLKCRFGTKSGIHNKSYMPRTPSNHIQCSLCTVECTGGYGENVFVSTEDQILHESHKPDNLVYIWLFQRYIIWQIICKSGAIFYKAILLDE